MLDYLRIRDLALIDDTELDFTDGMNVLTGETGAGKTFILKAIQFLLGEKLSADMVRKGREKAQVEAIFYLGGKEYMLRRELAAETGRSRFFLNGNVSSQETIKELRPLLILHVGQHGQQRLLQSSFQAQLVDDFIDDKSLIAKKDELAKALKHCIQEKNALLSKIETLKDKRELLELQQAEIEKVNPEPQEEENLESLRQQFKSIDHIQKIYDEGLEIIYGNDNNGGLLTQLAQLEKILSSLTKETDFEHNMDTAYESLLNFQEEAKELGNKFRCIPSPDVNSDMSLNDIEARLYQLAQLKRKLNRSIDQILTLKEEVEENLSFLDSCNLDIINAEKKEKELTHNLQKILEELNQAREKAAEKFCKALQNELRGLGFSEKVQVLPELINHNINKDGLEPCMEKTVRLLWAPNPGQNPQPLDKIASGGELSRFLLAVIGLQQNQYEDATLIFDEVDAGVGGITLNRVADRLSNLAEKRQMLLITHWPQLAMRGKNHFKISKEFIDDETFSRCVRLNEKEREHELSRMAGKEED